MSPLFPFRFLFAAAAILYTAASTIAAPSPTPQDASAALAFFESRIRPALIEQCADCHGSEKAEGGLRLDSRSALLTGGASGPTLDFTHPSQSRLVTTVRDDAPTPEHRVGPALRADLTAWIAAAAPWPSPIASPGNPPIRSAQTPEMVDAARRNHWAFQIVTRPAAPPVRNADWPASPIDAFILARLEAASLTPSPRADPRTLLRRLYFDLIGLPPTYEQVRDFESDPSPAAYADVVDRLLADPRFGERWGRHWLDIARYADTKGYLAGGRSRTYPFAFTYRDYVVRSFNEDKPYNTFLTEQIAADLLDTTKDDPNALAALGYLTLGRRFDGNQNDTLDDRIDVITRGTMALTVACARCHDHKYDAVPTADYYSLYGILRSTDEPEDENLPIISYPPPGPAVEKYEAELAALQKGVDDYLGNLAVTVTDEMRTRTADYLVYIARNHPNHRTERVLLNTERGQLRPGGIRRWEGYMLSFVQKHHPVWEPLLAMSGFPREGFAAKAAEYIATLTDDPAASYHVNPHILKALRDSPPQTIADVASVYGTLFEQTHADWKKTLADAPAAGDPPMALPDAALEQLRQEIYLADSPPTFTAASVEQVKGQGENDEINRLRGKVTELQAVSEGAPLRAMSIQADKPFDPYVFLRGGPGNRGPSVPRRFLTLLNTVDDTTYEDTGRLQLARAVTSSDNPLTARVLVNRVWMHLFDRGIVETADDFGVRSTPPTHPELLDHLAADFMDRGWSVKSVTRSIVLSSTYQQASADRPEVRAADPDNRLLWRQTRKRLEFEPLRDSAIYVAGRLSDQLGGRPHNLYEDPNNTRRTLYGRIDRQDLPGVLRTFDFATPDASTSQRPRTTVPQQQLFLMNSPFIVVQAKALAERVEQGGAASHADSAASLYHLILSRDPDSAELQFAADFLAQPAPSALSPEDPRRAWSYGYGRYDTQSDRLATFTPLTHFAEGRYQGGSELPDPTLHWVMLTAAGGHTGIDADHAAVRRFTAPAAMRVSVSARLVHPAAEGDGVEARLVSSTRGTLAHHTVHNGAADTLIESISLEAGETLDFIVSCRGDHGWDSFEWAPVIDPIDGDSPVRLPTFGSAADFAPPADIQTLTPLQQLAQALLMSNEFAFID